MPVVRNVSTDALDVELFGLHFEPGEEITVDDDIAEALLTNASFEIVTPPAKKAAEKEQSSGD